MKRSQFDAVANHSYSGEDFLRLLRSYGAFHEDCAETQEKLSTAIRKLVLDLGGMVTRKYSGTAYVARKRLEACVVDQSMRRKKQ